ncbi:NAD(P)-binding protein [Clavulina sp. PMI_390]|nr:NAD(P)-binding protein [Clavulina sp. PMI_390]
MAVEALVADIISVGLGAFLLFLIYLQQLQRMTGPVVAHVAPNGMVGKAFVPIFIEAVVEGEIAKLKLITSKETEILKEAVASAPSDKVELIVVDYKNKSALLAALQLTDVVVSTMGGQGASVGSEQALIKAASEAQVKVYFNSDFGSDYDEGTWGAASWEAKKAHAATARAFGLKTVSISNGVLMPFLRIPVLGVNGSEWEIIEDGNYSFALTHLPDVARYTLRAIILAYEDPSCIPDRVRVYSDAKTMNEYASIVERLTNTPVTRKYVPRAQLIVEWERSIGKNERPPLFLRIVAGTSATNFLGREHNELLNPGQKYFKPVSFEDFVKSTL